MVTAGLKIPSAGTIEELAMDSMHELSKSGTLAKYCHRANTLAHDLAKQHDGDPEKVANGMRDWCEKHAGVESFLLLFVVDHLADEIENGGDDD